MFEFDVENEYLGEWEPFRFDPEKDVQVYLRIRPLTEVFSQKNEKKFGIMRMNKRQGVRQRQIPEANKREASYARVFFMWTGIRNAYVKMTNEATADFFGKRLGKEFKVGDEVLLPEEFYHPRDMDVKAARPFDELKRLMVDQDQRISTKVVIVGQGFDEDEVEAAAESKKQEAEQEKELTKN